MEHFLDVVEERVFKVFFQDRVQQHCGEQGQILENPVPHMLEQLEEAPSTVSRNRIQKWTAEQIVDMSVPTEEELRGECRPGAVVGVPARRMEEVSQ